MLLIQNLWIQLFVSAWVECEFLKKNDNFKLLMHTQVYKEGKLNRKLSLVYGAKQEVTRYFWT